MADPVENDELPGAGISNAGPPLDPADEPTPPAAENPAAANSNAATGNNNAARQTGPKDSRAVPPAPSQETDDTPPPPNPTVDMLKQVLTLKNLDPHMEEMLRSARLRPTKDGAALLIDLPTNGHCLHCGKMKDGTEFIGMPHKKMIADEHDACVMVGLAKGRGWKSVNVTGTDKEKELIWLEAMRAGLTVANFRPDPMSDVARKWAEEFAAQPKPSVTEAKPEDFHLKTMQLLQDAVNAATDKDVKAGAEGLLKKFQEGTAIHGTAEIHKGLVEALSDKDERKSYNAAVDFLNKVEPKLALSALGPAPAAPVAAPKPDSRGPAMAPELL